MNKAAAFVLSTLIWFAASIWFFFGTLGVLLIGIFRSGKLFEACVKGLCRSVVWICGIRVSVRGCENYQAGRQYIIMMNHVNFFDGFVFYRSYPGKARGLEDENHFDWPVYGWVIRRMGQIPINRKSGIKAMESLRRAAALIRKDSAMSCAVFPEGTRTRSGLLGPIKKGGFLLALETGLDILPLVQIGAQRINHSPSLLIRPGRIDFVIEKPIPVAGHSKENISQLMDKVREVFLKYVE
jgi:1-acyl-sn-glycerol-3-phosphate acyltransferase